MVTFMLTPEDKSQILSKYDLNVLILWNWPNQKKHMKMT